MPIHDPDTACVFVFCHDARGRQTPDGVIFSKNVKDLSELKDDDEKAAEEALAAVSNCFVIVGAVRHPGRRLPPKVSIYRWCQLVWSMPLPVSTCLQ